MSFANGGHFVPASMCWMQYSTTLHRKSIAFSDAVKIQYLNTGILLYLAHIYVNCYVWPFYQCALTDIITWIGNHSHYFGEVVSAISEITAEKRRSHPSALSWKTPVPQEMFFCEAEIWNYGLLLSGIWWIVVRCVISCWLLNIYPDISWYMLTLFFVMNHVENNIIIIIIIITCASVKMTTAKMV